MKFSDLSNAKKSKLYIKNYSKWREKNKENHIGFFIVYTDFRDKQILKNINGNALKLYIFLGINSKNETGESWYTIEAISKYFGKSPRTISYWFEELERLNLIKRMQLEINGPSHTYLQPY
ncbi:TPA: helix-turn-helix domain-containing protein [Clostridium botulinum]|nr:helix-turn-helix domain-containing protein [Clostridium botulinum]HCL4459489.1 helix-turn-helix domain-containing protein [Clostridium botulinum]HCL4463194.1 helix-turn-helix domain-containing protein [Clostridium botulinum]HCL4474166.1 helix-turn-helix domain-containing protein [Clostridium botulinum]HCL4477842.1 helix-turn-helix domain-containing protein [Clostridium botulinum]